MQQSPQFKTFIVQINGKKYGDVVIGKYAEYIIWREQKNFFRNCPCKCKNNLTLDGKEINDLNKSRCPGFTVWTEAVKEAMRLGANILKVNFKVSNKTNQVDTYVIGLFEFISSAIIPDNENKPQYACALHRFTKVYI